MTRGRFVAVVLTLIVAVGLVTPSAQGRFWVLANGVLRYTGIVSATGWQAGNGSTSAPSYSFLSQPSTGLYAAGVAGYVAFASATSWVWTTGGTTFTMTGLGVNGWTAGTNPVGAIDTGLSRTAAGVVAVGNGTQGDVSGVLSAAEVRGTMAANGGFISVVKNLTELTTIAAAATTTTAIQIPANAVVLGVSVRVVTVIPTAATFTVTSATPTKTWNTAAVSAAANSTDPGTLGAPSFQTTASAITITPNLTPGAATGQVRVTIFYYTITPPSS